MPNIINNQQSMNWIPIQQYTEVKWKLLFEKESNLKNSNHILPKFVYDCVKFPNETQNSFKSSEILMLMNDETENQVCFLF